MRLFHVLLISEFLQYQFPIWFDEVIALVKIGFQDLDWSDKSKASYYINAFHQQVVQALQAKLESVQDSLYFTQKCTNLGVQVEEEGQDVFHPLNDCVEGLCGALNKLALQDKFEHLRTLDRQDMLEKK